MKLLVSAREDIPRRGHLTQTFGQESVKAFYLWIFNTVDTELARRVMGLERKAETEKKPEDRGQRAEGRRRERKITLNAERPRLNAQRESETVGTHPRFTD